MTVVAQEDRTRAIWPSCPSLGWTGGVDRLTSSPNGKALATPNNGTPFEIHGPYQHGGGFAAVNGDSNFEAVSAGMHGGMPITLSGPPVELHQHHGDRSTLPASTAAAVAAVKMPAAAPLAPRWVSAWGKCGDEQEIVQFLSEPKNKGAFKSLFMYGLVSIRGRNATVTYNDTEINTCTARINALGVLAEPILGVARDGWVALAEDPAVQQRVGKDLVAVGQRHGFHGFATDIEGPHKSARARLLKIFRAIHTGLHGSGLRFAPFIDYSTVYEDWTMYIPVSDRILDGMCYKSESEKAFFGNCRASAKPNSTTVNRAHTAHLGAALCSCAKPGDCCKKGKWGYSPAGARTRVQAVIDAGSPEIGMFNLKGTAAWWPPLLRAFLDNATVLPPPTPKPPAEQLPGTVVSMSRCSTASPRMQWNLVPAGGPVRPTANMSLCLDAGSIRPSTVLNLQPCVLHSPQQLWSFNSSSGHISNTNGGDTSSLCLDDNAGGIGRLGLRDCLSTTNKYQHFEADLEVAATQIKRSDGFCLVLTNATVGATSTSTAAANGLTASTPRTLSSAWAGTYIGLGQPRCDFVTFVPSFCHFIHHCFHHFVTLFPSFSLRSVFASEFGSSVYCEMQYIWPLFLDFSIEIAERMENFP